MTASPTENRMISRINGHLREADDIAAKYLKDHGIEVGPEFHIAKADAKAHVGLLYEAQRANEIAELSALVEVFNDGPDSLFDDQKIVEGLETRIRALVVGFLRE